MHQANIVSYLLEQFTIAFEKYKCGSNVTKNIEVYLKNSLATCSDWLRSHENLSCAEHKQHIISLFIKMKIFRHLKWESEKYINLLKDTSNKTVKPHRKVRILS